MTWTYFYSYGLFVGVLFATLLLTGLLDGHLSDDFRGTVIFVIIFVGLYKTQHHIEFKESQIERERVYEIEEKKQREIKKKEEKEQREINKLQDKYKKEQDIFLQNILPSLYRQIENINSTISLIAEKENKLYQLKQEVANNQNLKVVDRKIQEYRNLKNRLKHKLHQINSEVDTAFVISKISTMQNQTTFKKISNTLLNSTKDIIKDTESIQSSLETFSNSNYTNKTTPIKKINY